jgi:hypothetical protein
VTSSNAARSSTPTYKNNNGASTDTSRVRVDLSHLDLIPADEPASFVIHVDGSTPAELGVSVRAPSQATLPVRVNGSTRIGFRAEFVPREVGVHSVMVDYNGEPVAGTPFSSKVSFIDVKHFGYMTWTMNAWTDRSSMS